MKFPNGFLFKNFLREEKLDRLLKIPIISGIVKTKFKKKPLGVQQGTFLCDGTAQYHPSPGSGSEIGDRNLFEAWYDKPHVLLF